MTWPDTTTDERKEEVRTKVRNAMQTLSLDELDAYTRRYPGFSDTQKHEFLAALGELRQNADPIVK